MISCLRLLLLWLCVLYEVAFLRWLKQPRNRKYIVMLEKILYCILYSVSIVCIVLYVLDFLRSPPPAPIDYLVVNNSTSNCSFLKCISNNCSNN